MSATVIRGAARALNPDKPIRTLAGLVRCPRPQLKLGQTATAGRRLLYSKYCGTCSRIARRPFCS